MKTSKVSFELARKVLACFEFPPDQIESVFPESRRNCLSKLTSRILRSGYGFKFDWKGEFDSEFLKPLKKIARKLGVDLKYEYIEPVIPPLERVQLEISTGEWKGTSTIEYDGSDGASTLFNCIHTIEHATIGQLKFRLLTDTYPSDTYCLTVLTSVRWDFIRELTGSQFHDIFYHTRAEYEPTIGVPMDVVQTIFKSLSEGKMIEAIMHFKKYANVGAYEAKSGVERLVSLRSTIENLAF